MRILFFLDTYVPDRISGAIQMHSLAKELIRQGHRIAVITPRSQWLYEKGADSVDGVDVLRVKAPKTKDVAYVRRVIAEALLPYFLYRAFRRSRLSNGNWDLVVWYSPTIFLGPAISRIKKRYGAKSYLVLRDLFPDWAVDAGILRRGLAYRFLKRVEKFQYGLADVIGVQTSGNVRRVSETIPGSDTRIEVLENWLTLAEPKAEPGFPDQTILRGRKIFVYAGNMGTAQGMDCLLKLALSLKKRRDAGFLFVGRGSEMGRMREFVEENDLDNVLFMDEVSPERLSGILNRCHVGLISLDLRHSTHNIPGKFLTYLFAGLPVLARVNANNDLVRLIDKNGLGYVSTSEDVDELRELTLKYLNDPDGLLAMGWRVREMAQSRYSSYAAARQIINTFSADSVT